VGTAALGCPPRAARPAGLLPSTSEAPLTQLHIHLRPAKAHAFCFQPQPLLNGRIATQLDFSARAQHALPRQSKSAMQNPRHQPRATRQSRCSRDRSVRRHFTFRNSSYSGLDTHPHLRCMIGSGLIGRSLTDTHLPYKLRRRLAYLHSRIHPMRISQSDPNRTSSHNMTPCKSGRGPTRLIVATEMPLPIRNSVAVNPIFATFTATP